MGVEIHDSFEIHPGEWLREDLVGPLGLTQQAVADHLGVSRQALSGVLHERASVTAEMARRFELAFGIPASVLVQMQAAHDLKLARQSDLDVTPYNAA